MYLYIAIVALSEIVSSSFVSFSSNFRILQPGMSMALPARWPGNWLISTTRKPVQRCWSAQVARKPKSCCSKRSIGWSGC